MLNSKDIKKLIQEQKKAFATKKEIEYLIDIVATKEGLDKVATKVDGIAKKVGGLASKEDIKNLSKQLSSVSEDIKKNNKLKTRVEYIENILNIPAEK